MNSLKGKWLNIPITVKVSLAYAFCSIVQKAISLITLPLFTRLLTTEQYGQLTIYNSWQGILSIFITLNLAYGSFSKAMIKYDDDRDGYISSIEGITFVLAIIFICIYLPFNHFWNRLFELPTGIIIIMVFEIMFSNAFLMWSGKKRFEFKYKSVITLTLVNSFAAPLLAYILVINQNEKGYARIIGYAIVNIAIGLFFYVLNASRGKRVFNKQYWKYALGFNIPLLAYYLSQVIFNQSDRIMISHMVGKDKAAIYGVAYTIAMVLTFVLNAINNSYVPWYYEKIKQGHQADNVRVSTGIATFLALILTILIWFAPELTFILAGEQYSEAIYVIPPVTISVLLLFYAQLFINVEFYYEEKSKLVLASISSAVCNIILNYFLIQRFGYISAAYTTLFSYLLFVIGNYYAMKTVLNNNGVRDSAHNYSALVLILLFLIIASYIGVLLYESLLVRSLIWLTIFVLLLMNYKHVRKLYDYFKWSKDDE